MTIIWTDPHMKLHGKRHKSDSFYFRVHYGKQRMVYITKKYVDRPTAAQQASRQAFKELRQEVTRQLHHPILRARWEKRFKQDKEGYKMLHTYVYAKLKAGETVTQTATSRDVPATHLQHLTSRLGGFLLHNSIITPIFLPVKVPKQETCRDKTYSNFAYSTRRYST